MPRIVKDSIGGNVATTLKCDRCGSLDHVETVVIALGADGWVLDLCPEHRRDLGEAVGGLTSGARRISVPEVARLQEAGGVVRRAPYRAAEGVDMSDVRRWALEQGFPVAGTGRVSAELIAQYRAASDAQIHE